MKMIRKAIEKELRGRVNNYAPDGVHGYAGGKYFKTLANVQEWLSLDL